MGNTISCAAAEKKPPERRALEKVYDWFSKVEQSSEGDEIKIPREKFKAMFDYIEAIVIGPKNKRNGMDINSHCLQILNNRGSTASTMFITKLQHTLLKDHHLETTIIATVGEMKPEEILVVTCNNTQPGLPEKAAAKCLDGIQQHYKKIILIVLHVARRDKLPIDSSRKQLSGTDLGQLGVIVDMGFDNDEIYSCEKNDSAFDDIKTFYNNYKRADIDCDMQTIGKHLQEEEGQHILFHDSDKNKPVGDSVKPKVFIIDPSNTDATKCFIKDFESRMEQTGIAVDQKQIDDAKDLEPDSVLIVVCNNTSRIESDIENHLHPSLKKVYSRNILIVLHIVRNGKEPTFGSTKTKLETSSDSEKYASWDTIVDIAFDKDEGIYECQMNAKAFADLQKVFADI